MIQENRVLDLLVRNLPTIFCFLFTTRGTQTQGIDFHIHCEKYTSYSDRLVTTKQPVGDGLLTTLGGKFAHFEQLVTTQ